MDVLRLVLQSCDGELDDALLIAWLNGDATSQHLLKEKGAKFAWTVDGVERLRRASKCRVVEFARRAERIT